MTTKKVGLAKVSVEGGWPVDRQTTARQYEQVEHVPIVQEYDAPAVIHTETYRDQDGDLRTREWTQYERRERQVGTDIVRSDQTSYSTVGRIRFDSGRLTQSFSAPTWLRPHTRYSSIRIGHPLLRAEDTFVITGDGRIRTSRGFWTRLVTWRATRAAVAAVAAERDTLLAAIPPRTPLMRAEALQRNWQVCDGHWDAKSRKLRTYRGEVPLPGPTGRLRDGETVSVTLRCLARRDFAEQWMSAGTMDRPYVRRIGAIDQYVAELWRPIAMLLVGLGIAGYGTYVQNGPVVVLGVILAGLTIRAMSPKDQLASDQYGKRPYAIRDGQERMARRLWTYARREHDRRKGW